MNANAFGALVSHLRGTAHTAPPLLPEDNGLEQHAPVMSYQNGQPVYYGTPEAKQLALRGLQNVAAAHGTRGPQWAAAVKAALGVLGPDFQAPPDAFSADALNMVRGRQHQSSALRAALAARLLGGGL